MALIFLLLRFRIQISPREKNSSSAMATDTTNGAGQDEQTVSASELQGHGYVISAAELQGSQPRAELETREKKGELEAKERAMRENLK